MCPRIDFFLPHCGCTRRTALRDRDYCRRTWRLPPAVRARRLSAESNFARPIPTYHPEIYSHPNSYRTARDCLRRERPSCGDCRRSLREMSVVLDLLLLGSPESISFHSIPRYHRRPATHPHRRIAPVSYTH